jgi:hypothetical protein
MSSILVVRSRALALMTSLSADGPAVAKVMLPPVSDASRRSLPRVGTVAVGVGESEEREEVGIVSRGGPEKSPSPLRSGGSMQPIPAPRQR